MSGLIAAIGIADVLATVGTVLLWILAVVGILVGVLLVVPFGVRAAGAIGEDVLHGRVALTWGFGLFGFRAVTGEGLALTLVGLRVLRLRPGKRTDRGTKRPKRPRAAKPARKKAAKPGPSAIEWLAWLRAHRGAIKRFVGRVLRSFGARLRIRAVVGFDDPATTGQFVAALGLLPAPSKALDIVIQPDWQDEVFEMEGSFRAHLCPIWTVLRFVCGLLARDMRQALRARPRAARAAAKE